MSKIRRKHKLLRACLLCAKCGAESPPVSYLGDSRRMPSWSTVLAEAVRLRGWHMSKELDGPVCGRCCHVLGVVP